MREIKFRAWEPNTNQMWHWSGDSTSTFRTENIGITWEDVYCKYKWPLMQSTGLKDKNGVEIYEGDLIKTAVSENDFVGNVSHKNYQNGYIGEVFYSSGWYAIKLFDEQSEEEFPDLRWFFSDDDVMCLEVIGNIYKNPELLTKEE